MADQYNKILTTVNSVTSNYSFTPDLNNVIVVDTSNNRIGINTANPEFSIDISNGRIRTRFLEITEPSYGLIYEGTTAFGAGAIENLQVIYSATFESSCVVNIDNPANNALIVLGGVVINKNLDVSYIEVSNNLVVYL